MAQILFDHVCKFFGDTAALNDICLEFSDKKTTAVVGTSGSGKSTLLQHINGLAQPSQGRVEVFGQPINYAALRQLRLRIGYSVQGSGLFPHLSVKRNITLLAALENWEPERIDARAEELMTLVNLPLHFGTRYPYELSGGEQQRVGLCRAMMLDPPIFLLDEAFGALDPITRSEIHEEFFKLQRAAPRTIVLVTHDLREALKLADRIVILSKGRVEQAGPCADVVAHPATEFVKDFFETQLQE